MRLLIDTHVFLWSKMNDPRMSRTAWTMLRAPDNELLLSAVSIAEMAVKTSIGKLSLGVPVPEFVTTGMRNGQITELPMRISHAIELSTLPPHHRDPFDRLLIAQARAEGIPLMTDDSQMARYEVEV
ncbi:MAG: type II toxin-antitoxin system VapC family toxin, partial [Tepidisphaerales bacterium]